LSALQSKAITGLAARELHFSDKIESDRRSSARKLGYSMGIAASTVSHYLTDVLMTEYSHLRLVPNTLISSQKAARVDSGKLTLLTLAKYRTCHSHFLLTGDESEMFYFHHQEATSGPARMTLTTLRDHDHGFPQRNSRVSH
jgi:hypothetical protein